MFSIGAMLGMVYATYRSRELRKSMDAQDAAFKKKRDEHADKVIENLKIGFKNAKITIK